MSWPAIAHAVVPTARAVAWGPLLGAVTALAVIAGTARLAGGDGAGPLPELAAALLAAVTLEGAHDPAGRLLAAVPVSSFTRTLLRIALTVAPATLALIVLSAVLPARPMPLLMPGLALVLSGLALATWSPPDRGIHLAASVPVLWVTLHLVVGKAFGVGNGPLAWWQTDPVVVSAVAVGLVALGSRR